MDSRRIVFLDYMRTLACLIVVIGHKFASDVSAMFENQRNHIIIRELGEILHSVTIGGASGVVIFFLVSGYIITSVLQKEFSIDFFIKRIFRIYPLYMFAVVLDTLISSQGGAYWPPADVTIQRLLLIGDIYGTPLGLGGVEWTLRVEVAFYLFMGVLRAFRLTSSGNIMTIIMLAASYHIYTSAAIPWVQGFNKALFSLYSFFLFMGVIIFYIERKMVNIALGIVCLMVVFYLHMDMLSIYRPEWKEYNYALIGVGVFIIFWSSRERLVNNGFVKFFSDITYPMYLFHVTLWPAISIIVGKIDFHFINPKIQIVGLLILFCYVVNETIERYGIRLGRIISGRCSELVKVFFGGSPLPR